MKNEQVNVSFVINDKKYLNLNSIVYPRYCRTEENALPNYFCRKHVNEAPRMVV